MVASRFLALYCKYFIGDKCKYLGIKNKKKANISKGKHAPRHSEMARLGRAQILVTGLILFCILHSSNFVVLHILINNKIQLFKLQMFFVPLTMCT